MNRREIVAGILLAAVVAVAGVRTTITRAQERVWRLGFLTPGVAETGTPGSVRKTALEVLASRGFTEGRNLVYLPAAAEGDLARLPQLAEDLAKQKVDVVIAVGVLAARASIKASPNTPVVFSFANEDPVSTGFADSLARPGGSVTGIYFRAFETDAKRLELLNEALPEARVLGFLAAPSLETTRLELLTRTADRLGVSIVTRVVQGRDEYAAAFDAFRAAGARGALVMGTTLFSRDAPQFGRLGIERDIATICEWDYMAREGCTFGFGPNLIALRRLTGDYVARIFNGARPADLPIQQPDRMIFAVNQRSATQLKLNLSVPFLARADEVIE